MRILCAHEQSEQYAKQAYAIFCANRDRPWQFSTFVNALNKANSYIMLSQMHVIAFVLVNVTLDEADIEDISVAKSHQQQGVASALIRHVVQELRKQQVNKILLEVAVNNLAGLALYEKFDFQVIAKRKNYYQQSDGKHVDAIVMQKLL